jgi:hypothetical protein
MFAHANRFFNEANNASCASMASGTDAGESLKLRAQIMHSYLPPVDVELSIEFGGALYGQGDCRTIALHVSGERHMLVAGVADAATAAVQHLSILYREYADRF